MPLPACRGFDDQSQGRKLGLGELPLLQMGVAGLPKPGGGYLEGRVEETC